MAKKKLQPVKSVTKTREQTAWELRARGWTQIRIANHLGITQQSVQEMLVRISDRMSKDEPERIARIKSEQTERLDHIIDEVIKVWEGKKKKTKSDVEFLKMAMLALTDIRKIWGAEAATKTQVKTESEVRIHSVEMDLGEDDPPMEKKT